MTEPTKAAMRAAKALTTPGAPEAIVLNYAATIDAETGLPQLLAACKAAEDTF
jgi:hypothetical protein